jgi:hypothetical protein
MPAVQQASQAQPQSSVPEPRSQPVYRQNYSPVWQGPRLQVPQSLLAPVGERSCTRQLEEYLPP